MVLHAVPVPPSTEALIARLTDTAPVFRLRCGWCPGKPAIDGLGPIPVGYPASDGLCAACALKLNTELDALEAL